MSDDSTAALPVIDLEVFLKDPELKNEETRQLCQTLAETLKETSCLVVKSPKVTEDDNNRFLNMMEDYYNQPLELKQQDVHPELSYQLGATPEGTEVPRDHTQTLKKLENGNSAHVPKGPDPKWRYFWRIGERPKSTKFPSLNAPEVIPKKFPQWSEVMNQWGNLMLNTIHTVSQMCAIGLGLERDVFQKLLEHGPHLLAPTGSDLGKFDKVGTVLAGFHYDLNFLTIHGKSRYPGLFIWLRNGTKKRVVVPDGCLLLQAGKQMEWLTGGTVAAGFHEVVVTEQTLKAKEKAIERNRPTWRVSSTLFSHVASDKELKPLGQYATKEALEKYPPTLAGNQVSDELKMIKLSSDVAESPSKKLKADV